MNISKRESLFWLSVITILGAALRFYALGELPYGLYQDEAWHGLDALRVVETGQLDLFFTANNGREPLYIYLVTAAVGVFGRTVFAIRLPAAIIGTLTIPASYLASYALLQKRSIALFTAAFTAFTFWGIALSRVAFRAVTLPLIMALIAFFLISSFQKETTIQQICWGFLAGCLIGASLYTYTAAQLLYVTAVVTLFGLLIFGSSKIRIITTAACLGCLVVSSPMLSYMLQNGDVYFQRGGQVAIWGNQSSFLQLIGIVLQHVGKAANMFIWSGDHIARHNLPMRPVFDPVGSVAFVIGTLALGKQIFRRYRQQKQIDYAFGILLITSIMAIPTVLAEDTPHFLRGSGVFLPAMFIAAIGLDKSIGFLRNPVVTRTFATVLVVTIAARSATDYFFHYADTAHTRVFFQNAVRELTDRIDQNQSTYLEDRLWRDFASIQFLVDEESVTTFTTQESINSFDVDSQILVYPHNGTQNKVLATLAHSEVEIVRHNGVEYQGDLDTEGYPLFTEYLVLPDLDNGLSIAAFEDKITLHTLTITQLETKLEIEFNYSLQTPNVSQYVFFVHLLDSAGNLIAQKDQLPFAGDLPEKEWGQTASFTEIYNFKYASEDLTELRFGVYQIDSGKRLAIIDSTYPTLENSIVMPNMTWTIGNKK